jgi:pentatricopeptide repeat protein
MKIDGYQPDNITYSQLADVLCKSNRLDDARKVLDEIAESGCMPDLKTWTLFLKGQCTCGEFEGAHECLADMVERNLLPDGDLSDILVKAMCQANRLDEAYALFAEMVSRTGVKPFQASYRYLINELLRTKMIQEAHGLAKSMKNHNFPPFCEPFGMHIARYGTVEDAKELLKEFTRHQNPPTKLYLGLF